MVWCFGGGYGLLCGLLAVFFAQGGLAKPKLFWALTKQKGKWHWQRAFCLLMGLGLGLWYTPWLVSASPIPFLQKMTLLSCLMSTTITDLRHREIHMDAMVVYGVAGLVMACMGGSVNSFYGSLFGIGVGMVLLGLPHLVRPDSVGTGDVVLLAVCGSYLGAWGVLVLLSKGLILLAVVSICLLIGKKVNRKTDMPVAPFLFLGGLI